tara:strand:- start:507 stop:1229 length:723 start_codon:yes stop_codon:yes gene_type:complete
MTKKINILQPSFAPWIGFFEQINIVDIHCFMIDVLPDPKVNFKRTKIYNFNKGHAVGYNWFNSFIGKTPYLQNISEVKVSDYKNNIGKLIEYFQAHKKYFPYYSDVLEILNKSMNYEFIYEVNINIIKEVCKYFEFNNKEFIVLNKDDCYYKKNLDKSDYLISIIKKYKAQEYITGHGAYNYIDYSKFKKNDISLKFMEYKKNDYNLIKQDNFHPYLSIMDLIGKRGKSGKLFINSEGKI